MKKRRLHIILGSTLFGILLWLSINMTYDYQTIVIAPLIIKNLPQGMAIRTPIPRTLQLKLRGNGWRLASQLTGRDLDCVLDLADLAPKQHAIILTDIAERIDLPIGVQAIDMKPESLFVSLERYTEKRVPVVIEPSISFRDGYGQVGSVVIQPESVTIGGAESVLRDLSAWAAGRGAFSNLRASIDTDIDITDTSTQILSLSPTAVHVTVNVQPLAEKIFAGLSVEVRGEQPNREVILIPPKIELVVRGGIEQLSSLTKNDFRATVDYNTILADTTGYTEVEVIPPSGVQVVARRPDRLQYIVRTRL